MKSWSRQRRFVLILTMAVLTAGAGRAIAYNPLKICGGNLRCRIVDVLDRTWDNRTLFSSASVVDAWNQLRQPGPACTDVADVVLGGTFGENGAPDQSTPAGWAWHIRDANRCAIVVHYELEGPVSDAGAYDDSTEHGRRALAVVLNRLDRLRTAAGFTTPIRVWGHSKGASIVESTWRMEARNRNTKYITTLNGRNYYVDACPSNRCTYFGFGYPWTREGDSPFSISRATASTWTSSTDGYIAKPDTTHRDWHRLTTFTNYSDRIYECVGDDCARELVLNAACHDYTELLRERNTYAWLDEFNDPDADTPVWLGNVCAGS